MFNVISLEDLYRTKKTTILGALGAFCFIGIALLMYSFVIAPLYVDGKTIVLENDGFSPQEITIDIGDTVVFKTKIDEAFWPASNAHPSHTAYPDFDPRRPVAPNETWEFTFTEPGTYKFHDHINSTYEGVVYVREANGTVAEIDCENEKTAQCWEETIINTLDEEGVAPAFDKLVKLSETEPMFTDDCHGLAHLIGEEAYSLYVADEKFQLTPATALCGYGFYHGFMETLLLTTGDIQEARDFCIMADELLAGQASAAANACYHGTGHGAVDGSDPTTWGNIDMMMAPGFKLCDALAQSELQQYLCDTGVFNAIEILARDPKYDISELNDDPFEFLCNRQPLARREACYSNMTPILFTNYNNDLDKVFEYINEHMVDGDAPAIDGHTINGLTTLGVGFEFIRLHGSEPDYAEKGIALCRRQSEEDVLPCIEGLSGGHIKYGPPQNEYVKNLQFCALDMLTDEERDKCYEYTLRRIDGRYDIEKSREICQMIDVQYAEKYCAYY